MASYSENYGFALPTDEDEYDIQVYSDNFETLDTLMAEVEAETEKISERIGTPTEEGQTLFSLLNSGSSEGMTSIKSIQHILYTYNSSNTSVSKTINEVDASRCVVIMERLQDTSNSGTAQVEYTLSNTTLDISHGGGTMSITLKLGFWIIEFC